MTNDTPTLQLAVWDDPLAANGLQTDTDDALMYLKIEQPTEQQHQQRR